MLRPFWPRTGKSRPAPATAGGPGKARSHVHFRPRLEGLEERDVPSIQAISAIEPVPRDSTNGSSTAFRSALSDDARYLLFANDSSDLVPGLSRGPTRLFLKDRLSGGITPITGGNLTQLSNLAQLSGDGRRIVYFDHHVYVKDLDSGAVTLVSATADGTPANNSSSIPAMSRNGRYVAFPSRADNLVPGLTHVIPDHQIFLKDLQTGEIVHVSADSSGRSAFGNCDSPQVSEDGRYVTFRGNAGVFLWDRATRVVTSVNVAPDGTPGNGPAGLGNSPALSRDGRYVAFTSAATNLVPGDTNGIDDLFVWDRDTRSLTRANTASDGSQTDEFAANQVFSPDGRYLMFVSRAANLVPGDTNGTSDVFRKDLQSGAITRVSTSTDGAQGDGSSAGGSGTSVGGDRYVAFTSLATNLAARDTNGTWDVFVKDLQTGVTTLESKRDPSIPLPATGNSSSEDQSTSADGRYVLFQSRSTNLVPGVASSGEAIFLRDVWAGATTLVSTAADGTRGNGESRDPAISPDGRYAAFISIANNLVPGDERGTDDLFVKDLQTGAITRLIPGYSGGGGHVFSPDGRYVAFSTPSDLVPGDTNGVWDTYLVEVATGALTLASTGGSGGQPDGDSYDPAFSPDGRYLTFTSSATNLIAGDTNGVEDIFIKDLQGGSVRLVSSDQTGARSNGHSWFSAVSANGRYVAFASEATNLAPGDANGVSEVFIKDMQTGQVVRVGVNADGAEANGYSDFPAISSDGRYVAFQSPATNLVLGGGTDGYNIYVKDLHTNVVTLVTRAADGSAANGLSTGPLSLSASGRYLTFVSLASNLVLGDSNLNPDVFLAELDLAPAADAGGPYLVVQGGAVRLDASATTDPDQPAATLLYEWDLDGDGVYGEAGPAAARGGEVGIHPTFSADGLAGPAGVTVSLRVTDADGLSGTATATVQVSDQPLLLPDPDNPGQTALFVGGTPGADAFSLTRVGGAVRVTRNGVTLADYAGTGRIMVYGGGGNDTFAVDAAPAGGVTLDGGSGGDAYTVTFGDLAGTVAVADGGASGADSATVNGTPADDWITVKNGTVTRGEPVVETVTSAGVESLTVDGGGGNDTITDPDNANLTLLGGPGDDTIIVANTLGPVTADGGDGSDTYVVRAGSLQGPVAISDTGATGTDGVTVVGTPEADTFTQTGDRITANGGTVSLAGVDALTIDGGGGAGDTYTATGTPAVAPVVQGVSDTVVVGTAGADQFHVQPGSQPGQVTVRLNGLSVGTYAPSGRLVLHALAGGDDVQVTGGVAVPMWVYGGAGDDRLKGGGGDDVLLGGEDDDLLVGGGGRDLLVGGTGSDRLVGNADDDILIAGVYVGEADAARLGAVMAEWTRPDKTAAERVHNLKNGTGLNGGAVLNGTTVANDADADVLTGSAGYDWFLFDSGRDRVTDLHDEAFSDDLPFITGP